MKALRIQDISFFQELGPDSCAIVERNMRVVNVQKGQSVFNQSESCGAVYFVKSGKVKVYKLSPGGREQILEILSPGDTCACHSMSHEKNCESSAQALEDSQLWQLATEDLQKILKKNPILYKKLAHILSDKLRCVTALVEGISLRDTQNRLAKFLLDISGGQSQLKIEFTRQDLAGRLGMARETLARQLTQLKKQGIIEVRAKQIWIKEREKLSKLVQGEINYADDI